MIKNKMKMKPEIKWIIVVFFIIVLIAASYVAYHEYTTPIVQKQENTLYEYKQTQEATYRVNLLANMLYTADHLEEGKTYLGSFVKNIPVSFTYQLDSSIPATLKGSYKIIGQVRGYVIEEKEKKSIWTKDYELIPTKQFQKEEGDTTVVENLIIDYQTYNTFAKAVLEATQVNIDTEVVVSMIGDSIATMDGKEVKGEINTALIIPLNSSYFAIGKQVLEPTNEVIKETQELILPINMKKVIGYVGVSGVSLMVIVFAIFLIDKPTEEEQYDKKVSSMLTAHGSRLVTLKEMKPIGCLETYALNNIEDLIKVADELEKPVFYIPNQEEKSHYFYVVDYSTMFTYTLTVPERIIGEDSSKEHNL